MNSDDDFKWMNRNPWFNRLIISSNHPSHNSWWEQQVLENHIIKEIYIYSITCAVNKWKNAYVILARNDGCLLLFSPKIIGLRIYFEIQLSHVSKLLFFWLYNYESKYFEIQLIQSHIFFFWFWKCMVAWYFSKNQ